MLAMRQTEEGFPRSSNSPARAKRSLQALGGAVVVIFLVTLLAFVLSYLSPTDAAVHSFAEMGVAPTEEQLAAKRAELGLDQPFIMQFTSWLSRVLQGDLGTSYRTGAEVSAMLMSAIPYTLVLSFTSIALTLVLSVPLGLVCAYRRNGALDHVMRVVTYVFNSLPSFFVALLLLYVFSARLHLFDVMATRDFAGVLMPTLAMALPLSAWFMRQVRACAIEQLGLPYVDGLRARGVSDARILWVHVLRNMGVPLLTLIGGCSVFVGRIGYRGIHFQLARRGFGFYRGSERPRLSVYRCVCSCHGHFVFDPQCIDRCLLPADRSTSEDVRAVMRRGSARTRFFVMVGVMLSYVAVLILLPLAIPFDVNATELSASLTPPGSEGHVLGCDSMKPAMFWLARWRVDQNRFFWALPSWRWQFWWAARLGWQPDFLAARSTTCSLALSRHFRHFPALCWRWPLRASWGKAQST